MKPLHFIGVFLCLWLAYSCDTTQPVANQQLIEQRKLKEQYSELLTQYAEKMFKQINSIISPQSGKDFGKMLDLDHIYFDKIRNEVSVDVKYEWKARDFWAGIPYDWCVLVGRLYISLPRQRTDLVRAYFIGKDYNNHLQQVSTKSSLNKILDGIVVD